MTAGFTPTITLAVSVLLAATSHAESLVDGSVEAGQAKSVTCAACHGQAGNSANPQWPNLAGQNARYLVEQLNAFKDGLRVNALMSSQATMLTDEDMRNLAVYYESLPAPVAAVANPKTVAKAEAIYRGGRESADIPACLACHGPAGRGNAAAGYPALNGQHAAYTAKTLRDYATRARKSGGKTLVMQQIADRLTEDEIDALASYVQGLK
ncbi:MAG: c-type cytochrome [Woeseiaceae bacterium]|nr:c-type cytochrome [Woeseiaceae bacterium]